MNPIKITSRDQIAALFGRNLATVKDWSTGGMPGTPGNYDLGEIIRWREAWWERRLRDATSIDPELSGGDSPALEKYREQRAELARLDVLERKKTLVRIETLNKALNRLVGLMRGLGEWMKIHSATAHAKLNETLDECERVISEEFSPVSDEE
mgnify:CR=1 FL=1